MQTEKNTFFNELLLESGGDETLTETPQPFEKWGKKKFPSIQKEEKTKPAEKEEAPLSFDSMEELKNSLQNFTGCSLKKYAKHTIIGEGCIKKPLVMCIGEAPGADEDRTGRPFVGKSGQLLDKMLASIGLSREENTYITNVIPWRPPGNRTPTQEETFLCRPFILGQINLIRPKIIIFLGGSPTQALTNRTDGITRLRGKWLSISGIPALPIFHPAYLLRSPEKKKETWQDLLAIKKRLFT
ncbi:MAG: uracil-DNA glycosylase [Alphaproteobacteria bacterium]